MRFAPETLVMLLAGGGSAAALGPSPQVAPAPAPSPSPTPRYRLIPYGFETTQSRSTVPWLRFQDKAEVRSLEMNQAIARFFDRSDEKGNMLRGATPGGAPTLRDMASYRPHATAGVNLLGVAALAAQEIKKQLDRHKGMPPAEPSPSPTPKPPAWRRTARGGRSGQGARKGDRDAVSRG